MPDKTRRIHVLGSREMWSLKWDAFFLMESLKTLGINYSTNRVAFRQIVYLSSRYSAPKSQYHLLRNKVLFDYFHGDPAGSNEAAGLFRQICATKERFSGVRVSNSHMEAVLLNNGFAGKVFRIPIGVNLDWFPRQTAEKKLNVRYQMGIPQDAVVLGSFQKDGNGWGAGNDPKMIKGPDVFLKAVEILKSQVSDLFILLTGPARGFVKKGLTRLRVPFKHIADINAADMGKAYCALDIYLVASREEGGPKAVLEAMASGIPLVTTRVGQVVDLIEHQKSAWIAEIEDAEELAHAITCALGDERGTEEIIATARKVSESYSHEALLDDWLNVFRPLLRRDA